MSLPGLLDPFAVYPAFPAGRDGIVVAAPAKLNLFLEVLGKRSDGYHALESLLVAIDLFDTLEFRQAPSISLTCDPPGLPTGPENLVVRAATTLRDYLSKSDLGANIQLTKRIPTEAGLGGGSSDAAITLLALNRIWKLGLTREELGGIASLIGSDVAFFLAPPAAWCTGRGEIVSPETIGRALDFVLVKPLAGLSTAAVYRRLEVPAKPASGDAARKALRGDDLDAIGRTLFNRLEAAAFAVAPEVERVRNRLAALTPWGARLSGSGSTVFALCRDRDEAFRVAARFRVEEPPGSIVQVVRTLAPDRT